MTRSAPVLTILLVLVGCAHQKTESSKDSLFSQCRIGIENGSVYAGQSLLNFHEQYVQVHVSEVGDLKLYTYSRRPGFEGLTVVAKNGQLVRAFDWTDASPEHVYFDAMTDADRKMLKERPR